MNNFHTSKGRQLDILEETPDVNNIKLKTDFISITQNVDLDLMENQINGTSTSGLKTLITNNTNDIVSNQTANTNSITVNTALITTANTNISSLQTLTSTHETEITTLQNAGTGLFGDMNYFIMNSPTYYDMTGTGFGSITGSVLSSFELTSDPKRFIIGSLGIAQDTQSPNNFSFTESDTLIHFGWSANTVLVFYKMEMYDNSSGNRTLEFGMYDDHHNTNKFSIRHDVYMDSSSFRFKQVSGFAGSIAIQNYAKYYFWAKSNGGGKIQGVQFFLVKSNKNF